MNKGEQYTKEALRHIEPSMRGTVIEVVRDLVAAEVVRQCHAIIGETSVIEIAKMIQSERHRQERSK